MAKEDIEVFQVDGLSYPSYGRPEDLEKEGNAAKNRVAEDLRQVYLKVAERGGQVVGSHLFPVEPTGGYEFRGASVLYLVAQFPEGQSEATSGSPAPETGPTS